MAKVGLIPYFFDSEWKVVLITTRSQKKWTIPKGNVEKDLGTTKSAVLEAWEEAGLVLHSHFKRAPSYRHGKHLIKVRVGYVSLRLQRGFPEARKREVRAVTMKEAMSLLTNDALKTIIHDNWPEKNS